MGDLRLFARQVSYENRAFWRNPPAAGFTFGFPIMFLFIFNTVFGEGEFVIAGREANLSTFYIPALAAFSVISACFTNVAINVTFARDQGILKRGRGTPMPAWVYIGGRVAHAMLIGILLVVVVCVVGVFVYDVDLPSGTMLAFVVSLAIGAASFAALGMAITAAIPNAEASPAVVNGTILPLLFISDIFFGPEASPQWLTRIADLFPVRHFAEALVAAFNPFATGTGFEWGHLAVVGAWGAMGLVLAVRFFTWEPRR